MKRLIIIALMVACCVPSAFAASKESHVKKGNELYKKGDFDSSVKKYEDALKSVPESPEVNFNLGTALYKNKKYTDAVPYLQKGLLSNDPDLKKNAHFNLGDALFAAGLGMEKQNVDEAVKSLEESLRQFEAVRNLDDKDKDAQYNQGIAQRELERLRKKQQQQKQQRKENNEQKQDQDQQNQDQNKDSSQNNSDSQQEKSGQQNSQDDKKDEEQKPSFKPEEQAADEKDKGDKEQERKAQPVKMGEMTKEEAKDLLKQFEQNEQPAGLLNFGKTSSQDRPVLKDW